MSYWSRIEKNDALLRLFIMMISIKLLVSPWATGDFISSWGILVNYACDGGLMGIIAVQLRKFHYKYMPLVWMLLFSGLTFSLSTFLFTDKPISGAITTHLKLLLPILAIPTVISLASHSRLNIFRLVYGVSLLVVLLITVGLVAFPPSTNRLEIWLPTYFGGLHTSAYVALMTLFCLHALWTFKKLPTYKAWTLIIFLIILIMFGWGVRTASIGIALYFLGLICSRFLFKNKPALNAFFPMLLVIPIGLLPTLDVGSVDDVSSGRISMYIAKYNQLMENDLPQWLIGNGHLSDLIITDIWWWAAKGAHSDIISFLVEGGLIYLGVFLSAIFYLFKTQDTLSEKLIMTAVLTTSLFSNGVFARPIASYLLSLVFVIYVANRRPRKPHA